MKLNFHRHIPSTVPRRRSGIATHHFYWAIGLIGVVIIGYMGYFLYVYLYQTITQAETITILQQTVAPEAINRTKVDHVLQRIKTKIAATSTDDLITPDPFTFRSTITTVTPVVELQSATTTQQP